MWPLIKNKVKDPGLLLRTINALAFEGEQQQLHENEEVIELGDTIKS